MAHEGAYTVSQVCRILRPSMTARKVHYWLNTDVLSEPLVHGRQGVATLLTFRQLLEIRAVQHLRDELDFSLPKVRSAFQFILEHLFAEQWISMNFFKAVNGDLGVQLANGDAMTVPGGQGVLPTTIPELDEFVRSTRQSWEARVLGIEGHSQLVTNARVQAGAPVVLGTRIETSLIASFADDHCYVPDTVEELLRMYPSLTQGDVTQAMEFEGIALQPVP
jgi:uncharacterized protein (DUF433 family)